MTETTARTYHTMESLRQMAQTDLRNVNRKELVDINEVEIRKDLSQRERMVDFISQIKNPYCYLDKGMVVKISFAGENRLEDTLKKCARTHRRCKTERRTIHRQLCRIRVSERPERQEPSDYR